jgi:hypothetical protein
VSAAADQARIGRSRRIGGRAAQRADAPIDRRNIERRTQDLLGVPLKCARFRTDLGPVTRWAARRRLDKLPFLWNVLAGEMSLVGPKPEKEELVLRWRAMIPDYDRRFSVLPGLTGLAQVSGCPDSDLEGVRRRVMFDLHYIEHRSLVLDVRTLFRTAGVVWRRSREPHRVPRADATPAPSTVKGVTP